MIQYGVVRQGDASVFFDVLDGAFQSHFWSDLGGLQFAYSAALALEFRFQLHGLEQLSVGSEVDVPDLYVAVCHSVVFLLYHIRFLVVEIQRKREYTQSWNVHSVAV